MKPQTAEIQVPFLAQLLREDLTPVPALDAEPWSALKVPPELWERALSRPLTDFVERPGKELRARVVELSWMLGGGRPGTEPPTLPYLVEMLHAGSLIVDDIQDGSEMRRGAPSLHRIHGMPVALNAGNWLYFWPFFVLARISLPADATLSLYRCTSTTLLRCHQGQALDLTCRVHSLSARDVPAVVEAVTALKTGALMELAASMGAIAAGAESPRVEALARFGREAGMALQMLDDLSGLTSERRADKGLEDLRHARATWPWAWLAEQADEVTFALAQRQARDIERGGDPERLQSLLRFHVSSHGRSAADHRLDAALSDLREALGPSPALDSLTHEIDRLRRSYG